MPAPEPRRQVSDSRKSLYYLGLGLMVVGLLTFLSVFVTGALHFGDFTDFEGRTRSSMGRALVGGVLFFLGGILRSIGSRGLAGSGLVLDPERARKDIEPWSRMAGGAVRDALDEAGVELPRSEPAPAATDFDARLRKLHQLHQDGILSREEYEREKQQILERI